MTTTTPDLAAFLTARLDEDAAEARFVHVIDCSLAFVSPEHCPCDCGIPARALREVEAKRSIIKAHNRAEHYCPLPVLPGRHGQLWTPEEGACWTLHLLGAVWSDHPDYRQEWKL